MPIKVSDLIIEPNSKYSFTDRKEHQFCMTLLENFNSTKVGQERNEVIWPYLDQLTTILFMNVGNR